VIGALGTRISIAVVAVVLVGGSLTGCARGALTAQPAPAAGITATTPPPTAATGAGASTLQDIQGDLNSADSSVSNADGDVADADNSAATSDSP
jgi:hypothetical protein